jgi:RNA polymerase sigma factor (sigma-70 family)
MEARAPKDSSVGRRLTGYVLEYYQCGNEAGLEPFFQELTRYLDWYSMAKMRILCPYRRKDAVQDSLVHILQLLRARRYEAQKLEMGGVSILPWAQRVHHNLLISTVRGKKIPGKPNAEEDFSALVPLDKASQFPDVESASQAVEADKLVAAVTEAVFSLCEKERQAFMLCYYQGMAYKDMAAKLRVPEGTIKSRIHRALHQLKAWAERTLAKPSEDLYEALAHLEANDLFSEGATHDVAALKLFVRMKPTGLIPLKHKRPAKRARLRVAA